MKLNYKIIIESPTTHQVRVVIEGEKKAHEKTLDFFLPRWSPGSYLMREYSRHLSLFKAQTSQGEDLFFKQTDVSTFQVDWEKSELKNKSKENSFVLSYSVFCHELTVRTSHVDASHAFLHLPTLLMGIVSKELEDPTLELSFPPLWSKVTTALKDISTRREVFLYSAKNYDELIDTPVEIGCHETDGFMALGVPHDVAFYGNVLPHRENIKGDIKKIVEHIAGFMGGCPYERYSFITHFVPGLYGGLEHMNSTALQFCPTQIGNRKDYLNYLALVSHEYFHTWNVKRIRPAELGPFNYLKEATTKLLWLAEGLTSFMDELFVYRAGLMSLEEYLEMQKTNLNRYYSIPGKKFHSLDDSSFNAWIKLYRPDENSSNSSVSYYLKGGIVFFALNFLLFEKGKSVDDLIKILWEDYQKNPHRGVDADFIFKAVENLGGTSIREKFETMTSTTEEIDLESLSKGVGLKFEWDKTDAPYLGLDPEFVEGRVLVKSVALDGPAYKAGLNAGDEIIAVNGMRLLKDRFNDFAKFLRVDESYTFTVARLSTLTEVILNVGATPAKLRGFAVTDRPQLEKALKARI